MSDRRRLILDTDTGSDDVWAIVSALRAGDIARVEAITAVCGNFPLDLCAKNALLACGAAGTYAPPVYRGMERPLGHGQIYPAYEVHGADGLGDMDLPAPTGMPETKSAPEAIIDLVMANPGEIEIATIGPLTNIASAMLREPRLGPNIKMLWILGGTVGDRGNLTAAAEYNVGTDPEAADIVLSSGAKSVWVPWDLARGEAEITPADLERLNDGAPPARFCARCIRTLEEYYRRRYGADSFAVIDSVLIIGALYPEILETHPARCTLELRDGPLRGHMDIRFDAPEEANTLVCRRIDAAEYKRRLFALLGA